MKLRSITARVLALFRRRKLDRELDDQIQAHLELAEYDALAAGLTPENAVAEDSRVAWGWKPCHEPAF